MVLPLIGALAGAGGSIAAALLGADAEDEANQYNWMINLYNQRQQNKRQQQSMDFADELRKEQQLGGTDALGNRTHFVPGEGWKVDLSPEQQQLYDFFFKQELPERRAQFQRLADSSRENDDVANGLLQEFLNVERQLPQEAANQLYEVASRGIGEGARETTEAAMRQAARTGNSNIAGIMADIGRQTMDARRDARVNSQIQAKDYVDDKFNSQRGNLAQLYQAFLGMAGANLAPSFDPTGIPQGANSLMNVFSQQSQQGNAAAMNTRMQPAPTLSPIQPNTAWANAAGAIGSALSGLGDRAGSISERNDMNSLLKQYITAGGQFNLDGGGIFGTSADRLRAGGGIF